MSRVFIIFIALLFAGCSSTTGNFWEDLPLTCPECGANLEREQSYRPLGYWAAVYKTAQTTHYDCSCGKSWDVVMYPYGYDTKYFIVGCCHPKHRGFKLLPTYYYHRKAVNGKTNAIPPNQIEDYPLSLRMLN